MAIVRVRRGGGLDGHIQTGIIDTATEPGGDRVEAFVLARRARRGRRTPWPTLGPDQPAYTFEFDGRRVTVSEAELSPDVAAVVHRVLRP